MKTWFRRYIITCGITANMVALVMLILWVFRVIFPEQFVPPVTAGTAMALFIGFTVFSELYEIITKIWPWLVPKWLR